MGALRWISILVVIVAVLFGLRQYNRGCYCSEDVDLRGKVVVITGGHSGIGYETTRGLAKRGATVYIGCKDVNKAKDVVHNISVETKNENLHLIQLNLASFDSIREFAKEFIKQNQPIHILINNAGVWMDEAKEKTVDGFEMTFGVNHLGHFLLTKLLMDKIKEAGNSRVVTLSSALHKNGEVDFDNLDSQKNYTAFGAYCNSKLMNILFSNELARRYGEFGVKTYSLHPGVIATGLHRAVDNPLFVFFYASIWGFLGKDVEHGAQTTITAAISKSLEDQTGVYLSECAVAEPLETAKDVQLAKKLWEVSEDLVQNKLI